MIRMQHVRAIARAEMRLTRRLARYWIFLGLSFMSRPGHGAASRQEGGPATGGKRPLAKGARRAAQGG